MEFTIKKTPKSLNSVIRQNPYASGGKRYLNNYHRTNMRLSVTPPRKLSRVNDKKCESRNTYRFKPRSLSRGNNILQNSQVQNSSKENAKQSSWISKIDFESPPKTNKRPFRALKQSLDTSSDPYNIFSDDDEDDIFLSSKHEKMCRSDLDKENDNSVLKVAKTQKIYANNSATKRRPVNISKSNILHDISPEKVKNSLESEKNIIKKESENDKLKTLNGKENTLINKEECESSDINEYPHMIGFPNFGNTCYLNAVLQTIVSLQPFIVDLSNAVESVSVLSTSVTYSLWNIIVARQNLDISAVRNSLRIMKENVEKIDGSFSGYKMQDANEFLTQVLDTIKDEIDKFFTQTSNGNMKNNSTMMREKTPSVHPILPNGVIKENNNDLSPKQLDNCSTTSIFDTPNSSSPLSLELKINENYEHVLNDDDDKFLTPKRNTTTNNCFQSILPKASSTSTLRTKNKINVEHKLINPVISNFQFELLESYRCLGCGETEGRKQKHFALYVNLPSEGNESIQKAVEAYMSEDQRELTCEKCKHKRASFLTSFLQLPRVLIVQMKRYEYKPQQLECIKVSSKVDVNMWLHLDKLTSKDFSLPPQFVTQFVRELKFSNLSVPNLSPSLNNSTHSSADSSFTSCKCTTEPSSDSASATKEQDTKEKEDKELEEVMIRSLEEMGGDANKDKRIGPDKDEEFQRALRLSLQDAGTCYSQQQPSDERELKAQNRKEENVKTGQHSYHLISVISHFGLTTCTGHYISDILNVQESQWYHYDDESVTSLPESVLLSEARQKNGYIFFYVHKDIYHALKNEKT